MIRPDMMSLDPSLENPIIVDFKTTTNAYPKDFERAVVNYGYHHQGYLYSKGVEFIEHRFPRFLIVAQEKEEPYDLGIFTFSPK